MMKTAEHKVQMFQLAEERRQAGKPSWEYTVRGFRDILERDTPLIDKRDRLVALVKSSQWFRGADEFGDLHDLIDELSDVGHPDIDWDDDYSPERHFNACLDQLYDLADWGRAWLA